MINKLRKLKIIREYDLLKLLLISSITLIALFLYVIISGDYLEIVVTNKYIIKICNIIDTNKILNTITRFVMYYLNWIFVVYAIFQQKLFKYKPIAISIMIFIFWLIKTIFIQYDFHNYLDFLYFGFIAILCKKKWYRSLIGGVLVFIFALISSFIKNIFIPTIVFEQTSSLIILVFSIDFYLMSYIYYLFSIYRKENENEQLVNIFQIFKKVENYFSRIGKFTSDSTRSDSVSSSEIKTNLFNKYCAIIFFIVTYLSLIIIGILFNRVIEITLSVIYFHLLRGKEKETFHCSNDFYCWCVSIINFTVITKLTLPLEISYIVSIFLSFILCMFMRLIYYVFRKVNSSKRDIIIEVLGENTTEEDIDKFCANLGLNSKYSETIYLYINNTIEETSEILDIDSRTVSRRIDKI